jgi:hypothetical protein
VTSWSWRWGERWVCRHCNLPTQWDNTWYDGSVGPLTVGATGYPHTESSAANLADHYRRSHSHLAGVAIYLDGLREGG